MDRKSKNGFGFYVDNTDMISFKNFCKTKMNVIIFLSFSFFKTICIWEF